MQAFVAEEIIILPKSFDTVPTLEGTGLILQATVATMSHQMVMSLEALPAVPTLEAQLGLALLQQGMGTCALRFQRILLTLLHGLLFVCLQVDPLVGEQV